MSLTKVSIITVVYNNAENIQSAIKSVLSQDYSNIEYIVIDGNSNDGTIFAVEKFVDKIDCFISSSDLGIYDALNKGIELSTGEIIGILHSDDLFADNSVVSDMIHKLEKDDSEFIFSDLVIVNPDTKKLLRYYMAHYFRPWMLRIGWVPPHPTVFMKKNIFDEFGLYSLDYKIASDFDYFVRIFYGRKIYWTYLNRITVIMGSKGISNSGVSNKILMAREINQSLKKNKVKSLMIFQLLRYLIRVFEFLIKPKIKY
jgi:glycosyltransferase involved in cell wall biosynthesis